MHKNEATEEYVDNILAEEQHRIELIAEDLKTLKTTSIYFYRQIMKTQFLICVHF